MKKFLTVVLATIISLCLVVGVFGCTDKIDKLLKFRYNETDGTYTVRSMGIKQSTDLVIPSEYTNPDTKITGKVTQIAGYAFDGNKELRSVVIPDTVKIINSNAFAYCSNLEKVTFGNGVEEIGAWAFRSCDALESVTIGKNVISIGDGVFAYCNSLKTVNWEAENCLVAGYWDAPPFYLSHALTTINIAAGVKNIPGSTFAWCDKVSEITIPASVETIGGFAFYCCYGLQMAIFEQPNGWSTTHYDYGTVEEVDLSDPEMAAMQLATNHARDEFARA